MDELNSAGRKHNPEGWQGVLVWGVITDMAGYCKVLLETSNTETNTQLEKGPILKVLLI